MITMSSEKGEKKRKRIVLNIDEKMEILKRLKNGEAATSLAQEYNIGKSTINTIKNNEEKILKYHAETTVNANYIKNKKVISTAENSNLESAIYLWFLQQHAIGMPVSGPMLCEKALQLNSKMSGDPNFKASNGWLRNFKKRRGIQLLNIEGEKLSADVESAERFKTYIRNLIIAENYSEDCIYNADESGLYWRSLPCKTFASDVDANAPGLQNSRERVTIMFCSNASGSHKLPLFVVGKSQEPRCFERLSDLPIAYKGQNDGWMDTKVFSEWYVSHFIPNVREHQDKTGQKRKVLLILDNAPAHIAKDILSTSNESFQIVFLPPNVTSMLQPMDQGVKEKAKRLYRKSFLRRVLTLLDGDKSGLSCLSKLTLKDFCYIISEVWNDITEDYLCDAWKQLLHNEKVIDVKSASSCKEIDILEIHNVVQCIPYCANCSIEDTTWWLMSDKYDNGVQIFNDDDIISEVMRQETSETVMRYRNPLIPSDENDNEESCKKNDIEVSNIDALKSINTVIKWLEAQPESSMTNLQCLSSIRELIIMKFSNYT